MQEQNIKNIVLRAYRGDRLIFYHQDVNIGMIRFIAQQDWPKLITLYLSEKQLGDQQMQVLGRGKYESLLGLYLNKNRLTSISMIHLSKTQWTNLTSIELSDNKIGQLGCKYLTRIKMNQLQQLYLMNCNINKEGMKHIIKGKWPNLIKMLLNNNSNLTDESLSIVTKINTNKLRLISFLQMKSYPSIFLLADFPALQIFEGFYSHHKNEMKLASDLQKIQIKKIVRRWQNRFIQFYKKTVENYYNGSSHYQ